MTDNALKIIKDELARMLDGAADVYDQETDTYHPVNSDVKALTKALSVAVEAIEFMTMPITSECPTAEGLLKTIKNDTQRGNEAIKSIAEILSGEGETK